MCCVFSLMFWLRFQFLLFSRFFDSNFNFLNFLAVLAPVPISYVFSTFGLWFQIPVFSQHSVAVHQVSARRPRTRSVRKLLKRAVFGKEFRSGCCDKFRWIFWPVSHFPCCANSNFLCFVHVLVLGIFPVIFFSIQARYLSSPWSYIALGNVSCVFSAFVFATHSSYQRFPISRLWP